MNTSKTLAICKISKAQNVHFYTKAEKLPKKYQSALQDVR